MVAYVGWHRDTEVPVEVEIIGGIAGKVRCFECEGVPAEEYASWFPPGAVAGCVDCKGTRRPLQPAWETARPAWRNFRATRRVLGEPSPPKPPARGQGLRREADAYAYLR